MKVMTFILFATSSALLTGCVPSSNTKTPTAIEYVKPSVGQTATVSMGDPVLKSATGFMTDAIELGNAKGALSTIAAGTYCNVGGNVYQNIQNERAVGLGDLYGNINSYVNYVTYDSSKNIVMPPNGTNYNSTEISIKKIPKYLCLVSDSLVKSIEYNGNAAGVMKFTYREFAQGMARQAFTTDFTVDSKGSDIVTYKGARIKVIKADNSSINYTVLSGFDSQNTF